MTHKVQNKDNKLDSLALVLACCILKSAQETAGHWTTTSLEVLASLKSVLSEMEAKDPNSSKKLRINLEKRCEELLSLKGPLKYAELALTQSKAGDVEDSTIVSWLESVLKGAHREEKLEQPAEKFNPIKPVSRDQMPEDDEEEPEEVEVPVESAKHEAPGKPKAEKNDKSAAKPGKKTEKKQEKAEKKNKKQQQAQADEAEEEPDEAELEKIAKSVQIQANLGREKKKPEAKQQSEKKSKDDPAAKEPAGKKEAELEDVDSEMEQMQLTLTEIQSEAVNLIEGLGPVMEQLNTFQIWAANLKKGLQDVQHNAAVALENLQTLQDKMPPQTEKGNK